MLLCSSGAGGGTPHMKVVRMLVVSLRRVNFGFWSHLGCSGPSYLAVKVSFRVAPEKMSKYIFDMYIFNSFSLLHCYNPSFLICLCFTWPLLGIKKSLGHAQIGLL